MISNWTSRRIALAALVLAKLVQAQAPNPLPPPADRDPFVGMWKADGDKSRPKLSKAELTYVRTIGRSDDYLLFSSTGGASKAKPEDRKYRLRCDGGFYPQPAGSTLSCTWVASNRVVGVSKSPDGKKQYWSREVSADGESMTITGFKDQTRTKVESVQVLERVR